MSEQSFTPGPLIVVETRSYFAVKPIGMMSGKHQHGRTIAMCAKPHPSAFADATLFAAAPALLEALKALIPTNVGNPAASIPDDQVLPVDMTVGELRKALAAISQAEGRDHG